MIWLENNVVWIIMNGTVFIVLSTIPNVKASFSCKITLYPKVITRCKLVLLAVNKFLFFLKSLAYSTFKSSVFYSFIVWCTFSIQLIEVVNSILILPTIHILFSFYLYSFRSFICELDPSHSFYAREPSIFRRKSRNSFLKWTKCLNNAPEKRPSELWEQYIHPSLMPKETNLCWGNAL